MNLREWLMLFTLAAIWGASFFLIAVAVQELPPLTIVLLRLGFAAATLWLMVFLQGTTVPRSAEVWVAFLVMGLLNNALPFVLIVWGQTHIESGLAAILNATTPLATVLVAGCLLVDERFSAAKIIGVTLGFVGVLIMLLSSLDAGLNARLLGQLAVLAAATSYAFAAAWGRRFRRLGISPLMTATGQVTCSTLLLLPFALLLERPFLSAMPSPTTWLAIIALAVVCTAFAYILYFRILSTAGAINLALVTLLVPVTAVLLGTFVLGESLRSNHAIGMLLIAAGLAVIDGRLWRHIRRPLA